MSRRFEHHARRFALLTLVSRFTGLARDAVLSRAFGAGALMDAFFFAFIVPNLFRRLFGEGALAAAFVPAYTRLDRDDPKIARQLATLIIARVALVLCGVVLIAEAVLLIISQAQSEVHLAIWLMMIMLPYTPLVCLVALLGAMLQVHGRFGPSAAAPIILNLCIIGAATGGGSIAQWAAGSLMSSPIVTPQAAHVGIVAGSVLIAGLIQFTWCAMALRRTQWWSRATPDVRPHFRGVVRQAGPMILGLGVLQLNTLLDGLIASYPTTIGPTIFGVDYPLTEGAMSAVSYAQRLYQFPLGVFGIAVATAIFPALSRVSDDADQFTHVLQRGLRLVVFIGVPASISLMLVRQPLTAVVFRGGDFGEADVLRVGRVLLGYAAAVWAYSMTHVLTRAFYARGEAKTPVRIAISMIALNLALNCALIWTPLREAGLAWSTALCGALQALVLAVVLRRRIGAVMIDRDVAQSWMWTCILSLAMGAAVWGFGVLAFADGATSWRGQLLGLVGLTVTGAAVFSAGAVILKRPEWRWFLSRD